MLNSFTQIIALPWHRALFVGAVKITYSGILADQYIGGAQVMGNGKTLVLSLFPAS